MTEYNQNNNLNMIPTYSSNISPQKNPNWYQYLFKTTERPCISEANVDFNSASKYPNIIKSILNKCKTKKIQPQSPVSQSSNMNTTDDITTYIRCIFHDFRGPLNNISLGTEVLLNSIKNDSDEFATAKTIQDSCKFLSEILDGFLNVNKMDDQKINEMDIIFHPFNIVGLIKKIQYILLFNIMEKKIEIKYNISPLQEWVIGDYKKIQHVLMNLLSNAIKFSETKSSIEINLQGEKVNNNKQHIIVTIIDNNPFISSKIKSHLFEKYNTSDNKEGTGLGLYICKKIIENHGGIINHYTKSPRRNSHCRGNIFRVELFLDVCAASTDNQSVPIMEKKTLSKQSVKNISTNKKSYSQPRKLESSSEEKQEKQENDHLGFVGLLTPHNCAKSKFRTISNNSNELPEQNTKKTIKKTESVIWNNSRMLLHKSVDYLGIVNSNNGKIRENQNQEKINTMVIDDSELSRKLMIKLIQQNNPEYEIYNAIDGLDGLIKMINLNEKNITINMILVDNVMPNLNGELFCKIMRGMGYKGIIIGVTGNGLEEDIQQYLDNGADHIFIKPFNTEKLVSLVKFVDKHGYESHCDKKIENIDGVLTWV
jgi:nitrogen-specific signal transduction histidine kinase/CheY-like chemotaxis protein